MKRILRWVGLFLALVVAAAAAFAGYVHVRGIPSYPVESIDLKIEVTPARVERGRRLSSMLCMNCHLDPETGVLSGKRMVDVPTAFGTVYSRNITKDPVHGIGAWTDGEIAFLLRTGIRRNGRYAPPYMVKLPRASDEDIASIIAFLRSDDETLAPSSRPSRDSDVTFLTKLLTHVVFKPFPYPKAAIAAPDPADTVRYGRYLADSLLSCYACHSADFTTNDDFAPEKSKGFYGGGTALLDANGQTMLSANITPHTQAGIGGWTEAQFLRAVKEGFRPDNSPILYPMEVYAEMTDEEAKAIYAYLKTVPALSTTRAPRAPVTVTASASPGQKVYEYYRCSSCHGPDGTGLCDLRHATERFPSDADLVEFIKSPALAVPGSKMPAWAGVIREEEYADLVAYIRTLQAPSTGQPQVAGQP